MASAGLKLLGSIQNVGDLSKFDLSEDLFVGGKEVDVYTFATEHALKHGVYPSGEAFLEQGIVLPSTEEPPSYYYDQVIDRYMKVEMKKTMIEASDMVNNKDYVEGLKLLSGMCAALYHREQPNKLVNYIEQGNSAVLAAYANAQLPDNEGVRLGWNTPDQMTGGLHGGDVATIVGRPGAGKTFMMLYIALNCWLQGKVPLFVSMEMKPLPIMQRLTAMMLNLPLTNIVTGTLPTELYNSMSTGLQDITGKHPFHILDGALSSTIEDITLQAQQLRPDIVLIDAAYLLRHPDKRLGRWDRATQNMEDMKSVLAEGLDIPVACSHQLNREAQKKINKGKEDELGVEDIAQTDSVGQISSLVMALLQAEKIEDNHLIDTRAVTIMKGRSGETGSFNIRWEFQNGPNWLQFGEMDSVQDGKLYY